MRVLEHRPEDKRSFVVSGVVATPCGDMEIIKRSRLSENYENLINFIHKLSIEFMETFCKDNVPISWSDTVCYCHTCSPYVMQMPYGAFLEDVLYCILHLVWKPPPPQVVSVAFDTNDFRLKRLVVSVYSHPAATVRNDAWF